MKKEEFRSYLSGSIQKKPISDRLSRCAAVECALKIDLDEEYAKDRGVTVLSKITYGKRDVDAGVPLPKGFSFKEGCNVVQRMTDLRSAVKMYFSFCDTIR